MTTKRGTSIIEIVIAAALISVSVIAALSLTNRSQKQNTYSRDLSEATKYATQAADWLRTERDILGWATMADKVTTDGTDSVYCLNNFPATDSDFTQITPGACTQGDYIPSTQFTRYAIVDTSSIATRVIKFSLTVSWMENELRQSVIELELAQWH